MQIFLIDTMSSKGETLTIKPNMAFCASMFGALKRGRFRSLASLSYTCSECGWRTSTEKNTCSIARFPCGSTAFLYFVRQSSAECLCLLPQNALVNHSGLVSFILNVVIICL